MEGPAHGALVAGANSSLVAVWIRNKALERYDPDVEPPPIRERINNRAPYVLAGLGFTGLSTAVAMGFDAAEMKLLQDYESELHYRKQVENHHELHSLPYLGAGVGAAYLLKHTVGQFARWLGKKLKVPRIAERLAEALEELSEWVINSIGTGVAGHLVGDIPTKGRGGTALRLLAPITNRNFCLGWVRAVSTTANQYLVYLGSILTGAAWAITGIYAASWKPPEQRIGAYVDDLRDRNSARDALRKIQKDVAQAIANALGVARDKVGELPLFTNTNQNGILNKLTFDIDPKLFGVNSLSMREFTEADVLPADLVESASTESMFDRTKDWPEANGVPLVHPENVEDTGAELFANTDMDDGTNLFTTSAESKDKPISEPLFTKSGELDTEDL